jgi:anti-sigma factor RsiW
MQRVCYREIVAALADAIMARLPWPTKDKTMPNEVAHLSDGEILLAADGELSTRRAAEVRAHLDACRGCRGRMTEIEATIAAFEQAYKQTPDLQLPSIRSARALLVARLYELTSKHEAASRQRLLNSTSATRTAAFIG